MRKHWVIGGVVLAVVAAAGIGAAAMMKNGDAISPTLAQNGEGGPAPLEFAQREVTQPVLGALPLTVEFSGPLAAPQTAVVRAKASGTLLSLNVAEGSRVKAGQQLGSIDLAELASRVAERKAMVESQRAQMVQAQRTHESNERLAAQNFISSIALENSRASLDAARAQLRAVQAQADALGVNLRDAALISPIAGIVGKKSVVAGEKVSAEQPLLTVVDLSTLELNGTVGTHEVSLLKAGQPVEVKVEGIAAPVTGHIDRIAPAAEAGTRAIGVVVKLENPGELFRAGQYAQARAELADDTRRMTLPLNAVGQASGQDYVWTLEKNALVRRIVITGRQDAATGRIEIKSGVNPGAMVLAARFDNLKEGQPAKVVAERAAPTASTPASAAPKS